MKLRLYSYWRSSASHRVRIGLELKGLAYEYVAVHLLHQEQLGEAHRAKNPMAQVPVLEVTEDDGTVRTMTQSLAILEYLDECWPEPPILPSLPHLHGAGAAADRHSAFLRARCRALAEIINSGIQPFQNLATLREIKALGGDEQAWARGRIAAGLAAFEALARDVSAGFSVGDAPTIADCCLVPQLEAARRFGVDLAKHDLLLAIEQRCLALPAFQRAAPQAQPDAVKS